MLSSSHQSILKLKQIRVRKKRIDIENKMHKQKMARLKETHLKIENARSAEKKNEIMEIKQK